MKWVTRERPKIDRIACPWLVARFIDRDPEFLFVPPGEVLAVACGGAAIPYDVPNVELSHVGELCSFDAFLRKYRLVDDPALAELARLLEAGLAALAPQPGHVAGKRFPIPAAKKTAHRHSRRLAEFLLDFAEMPVFRDAVGPDAFIALTEQ